MSNIFGLEGGYESKVSTKSDRGNLRPRLNSSVMVPKYLLWRMIPQGLVVYSLRRSHLATALSMGPGGRTLSWTWIGRSRNCGERAAIVVRTQIPRKWACSRRRNITITLKGFRLILILEDVLAKLIVTCTLHRSRQGRSGLVEGYITSFDDPVSLKNKNTIASRLKSIAMKKPPSEQSICNQKHAGGTL